MATCTLEEVSEVKHWTETLFSFKTTRNKSLRFQNGHFLMIGLEVDGKPLLRAYSVVSPNYEDHLEFLSIKIPDGALTSRLKLIKPGDKILVGEKSVGTLVIDDLKPGKRLYLLSTGTGLALAAKLNKKDQISIIHIGDGAIEEGAFYESLNFSVVKEIPALFFCENNLYSVYSPLDVRQPNERSLCKLASAIGAHVIKSDGKY